jgi:hypothetical protein
MNTIGKGLAATWNKQEEIRLSKYPNSPKTPLDSFMRYNYKERYVALCNRVGVEPCTFSKWLQKSIDTLL